MHLYKPLLFLLLHSDYSTPSKCTLLINSVNYRWQLLIEAVQYIHVHDIVVKYNSYLSVSEQYEPLQGSYCSLTDR